MKRFKGYEHGINLGGWLSQCTHTKERYENFIKEEDIKKISLWGLDHIRLPVDYEVFQDKEGVFIEEGFSRVEKLMDWCTKYELNVVLDLHKTFGFSFDSGEGENGFFENLEYQERFYQLWEKLAGRFSKYKDKIAFELLNEVTEKKYSDTWNGIIDKCIKVIRKYTKETKIIIGGYFNNSIAALPDLINPEDDNIVYTFHCYEPIIFTHQGAYWIQEMDKNFRTGINCSYNELEKMSKKNLAYTAVDFSKFKSESIFSKEFFSELLSQAVRIAEERGHALYCGEYGVINLAQEGDTLNWYKMICSAFDDFHIGRAAWSYKEMDFGFIDKHMENILPELIKII